MSNDSFSSSSSSLQTDSDWEEEAKRPITQVQRTSIPYRIQELASPEQYVEEMLAQVKDEARLMIEDSVSCEISSNSISNPNEDLSDYSALGTEKITEINNFLAKGFVNALMAFKSTTRPILATPLGKRRGGFLITNDLISTIEPLDKSFRNDDKRKNYLTQSLKKIQNLQKIKSRNMTCLESQLKEIKFIDSEREELKDKIEVLSRSLDDIFKERKDLSRSTCKCILF